MKAQDRFPVGYDRHVDEVGGCFGIEQKRSRLGELVRAVTKIRDFFRRERWISIDELIKEQGERIARVTKKITIYGNGENFVGTRRTKYMETMSVREFVENLQNEWPYLKQRPYIMQKGDSIKASYNKRVEEVEYKLRLQ